MVVLNMKSRRGRIAVLIAACLLAATCHRAYADERIEIIDQRMGAGVGPAGRQDPGHTMLLE